MTSLSTISPLPSSDMKTINKPFADADGFLPTHTYIQTRKLRKFHESPMFQKRQNQIQTQQAGHAISSIKLLEQSQQKEDSHSKKQKKKKKRESGQAQSRFSYCLLTELTSNNGFCYIDSYICTTQLRDWSHILVVTTEFKLFFHFKNITFHSEFVNILTYFLNNLVLHIIQVSSTTVLLENFIFNSETDTFPQKKTYLQQTQYLLKSVIYQFIKM